MGNTASRVTIHMAASLDGFIMGSRTYETALRFEAQGLGWSYGDKPTCVLTSRELQRTRDTVESEKLDRDIALHLAQVKAYKGGVVELRYELRR